MSPIKTLFAPLIVALALLLVGLGRWHQGDQDWSHFAVMGEQFTDRQALPDPTWRVFPGSGYDGQYFFRLALNPWTIAQADKGITFNFPAYRHQRLLYPLTVHALSFGHQGAVPFLMVLVNFISLIVVAWTIVLLADPSRSKVHAGCLAALGPGLVMAFGRDLSEAMTGAWLVLATLALFRDRRKSFIIFITMAIWTREAALLGALAAWMLAVVTFVRRRQKSDLVRVGIFTLPMVAFIGWQLILKNLWGEIPVFSAPANRGWPFLGFFRQLAINPYQEKPVEMAIQLLYLGWHVLLAGLVIRLALREAPLGGLFGKGVSFGDPTASHFARSWLWLTWLFWSLLAVSFSELVWLDDWGFTRILSDWSLLGVLLLVTREAKSSGTLSVFSGWTALLFFGTAIRLILKP